MDTDLNPYFDVKPTIYFEDQHLIVINKPAGLLSQGDDSGTPSLVDWARFHFGRHYVGLVHRLDRNTSGLMVIAKRSKSAERLTQQLQTGKLMREYVAWCVGKVVLQKAQEWIHYLVKNESTNLVKAYADTAQIPSSLQAHAQYAKLTAVAQQHALLNHTTCSLVKFVLETGRSHQIRSQAQAMGHPLIGDQKYGGPSLGAMYPLLHSCALSFEHPISKTLMEFVSPAPFQDLEKINEGMR